MAGESNDFRLRANLTELQADWQDRITDAEVWLAANRPASALAMGEYALEIFLKTRICQHLDLDQLPIAFEIHQLDRLLTLSGLNKRLKQSRKAKVNQHWEQLLDALRQINNYRYRSDSIWNLTGATALLPCLTDPHDGVLVWLGSQR